MAETVQVSDPVEGKRGLTPIEEGQVGVLRAILAKLAQQGPSPAIGGGGAGWFKEVQAAVDVILLHV